jgi:mono/diheme cytochrome c family protein
MLQRIILAGVGIAHRCRASFRTWGSPAQRDREPQPDGPSDRRLPALSLALATLAAVLACQHLSDRHAALLRSTGPASPAASSERGASLLVSRCAGCHGSGQTSIEIGASMDREVLRLKRAVWDRVLNVLASNAMLAHCGEPVPEEERRQIAQWLTHEMASLDEERESLRAAEVAKPLIKEFSKASGIDWDSLTFWRAVEPPAKLWKARTTAGQEIVCIEPERTPQNRMYEYNCHGLTFGSLNVPNGPFLINPKHVNTILQEENGWTRIALPQPPAHGFLGAWINTPAPALQLPPLKKADVVAWKRWHRTEQTWIYDHSVRVVKPVNVNGGTAASFAKTLVVSKNGIQDIRFAAPLEHVHGAYNVFAEAPRLIEIWRRQ